MHVRRGEHALRGVHSELGTEYYSKALKFLGNEDAVILIFSDNIDYCKNIYGEEFLSSPVYYSTGSSELVDWVALSICDHNIAANSGFGFVGAALSKFPKTICYPRRLTRTVDHNNPNYLGTVNTNNLYFPDEWLPIEN
jgi:hypothetical protein